jgi:DNA-binding NarL/FixJ family response regulator
MVSHPEYLNPRRAADARSASLDVLSLAEREVLMLMGDGLRNRAIARKLHRSEKTVEKHVARIFEKLELQDPTVDRRVLAARILCEWCEPLTALALLLTGG